MQFAFHTLDVFTSDRFGGNPLSVVLGADDLTAAQMQTIAREFNFSETIFVMRPRRAEHTASVRIFYPTGELPFAGHPTIGCAILLAELLVGKDEGFRTTIHLEELAGTVPVTVHRFAGKTWAQLTAPVVPSAVSTSLPSPSILAPALGLSDKDVDDSEKGMGLHEGGGRGFSVAINSLDALARARPRSLDLAAVLEPLGVNGIYLYARREDGRETAYRTRMLIPYNGGLVEDPATGSAAVFFASHLHETKKLSDGIHTFRLEQGYEMARPSTLNLEVEVVTGRLAAVRVAGSAVRVMQGQLTL